MFNRPVILLALTLCIYTQFNIAKDYGLTEIHVDKFEECKGPKRNNCSTAIFIIDGKNRVIIDFNVTENINLAHGKIIGYSNGKEVLKFPNEKPCNNVLINVVFRQYMNIKDDCTVLKGHYRLILDLEDISRKFYDSHYFFGNITVKSSFYSDKCNFLCCILKLEILPRNRQ